MGSRIFLALSLFIIIGCTPSLADLNKIAKDALKSNQELKEQSLTLDSRYVDADKDTILDVFGKPRKMSNEPYPYKLDVNCYGKECPQDYSDEIWFYEFKRKFSSGWEAYSVYVYFKEGKVVRIR